MTMLLLPQMLEVWGSTLGWQPTEGQSAQFQQLYDVILAGNRQLNLTRITAPDEFWEKHLWDSLRGVQPWLNPSGINPQEHQWQNHQWQPNHLPQRAIDIGTGAGFPGLPVAIAQPSWHLTLLDSTRKRTAFLDTAITTLHLPHVQTLTDRAEAIGQQPLHREHYDLALIRAVAGATVCAEYALPLLRLGGIAVLYRGQWTAAEAIGLAAAVPQLGGQVLATEAFSTPISQGERHCIYLRKETPTPRMYPRAIGVPVQKPIFAL